MYKENRRPYDRNIVVAPVSLLDIQKLEKIIKDGDMSILNDYASELGKALKDGDNRNKALSTSQIRSILDELQRLKEDDINGLHLLRPQIAYAAGRHGGKVKQLQEVMEEAIKITISSGKKDNLERLKNFFEAIVAYHRFYGGKE